MSALIRWQPYHRLSPWRRSANWANACLAPYWDSRTAMPVDVKDQEDAIVIQASVPGFEPDDVNITVESNVLTIHAEQQTETQAEHEGYYLSERYQGAVERSFRLPDTVNGDEIQAELKHGILTQSVPKSPEAEPVKIKVKPA